MAKAPPSKARNRIQPDFPALVAYTNDFLYGEIWERPGLSKRDRSLITVAALLATHRPAQLKVHIRRALDHGVTKEEIAEIVTHLAFYAGWPAAMTAAQGAMDIYEGETD
jgi:4-carboxymuconolactone decarboxylase